MTAFASGERTTPWGTLSCELRSVNHRFLEIGTRLPEELRALEPALRERVSARISRGKLDLGMRLRAPEGGDALHVDTAMVDQLAGVARELQARFPTMQIGFTDLLGFPACSAHALPIRRRCRPRPLAARSGVAEFVASREREGANLAAVMSERVDAIARIAAEVRKLMPDIRAALRQKLEARLAELAQPVDPGRFEQELVIGLQKLDVDEELDRLDSHVAELRRVLTQREPVGRRLDFLLQEFNREANTLGSKSVDARTSAAAVELKVLIDQVREQIQNIE
jgi:uncharacterized protein (TIGR00255 family)